MASDSTRLTVVYHDPDQAQPQVVGQVDLSASGMLEVVSAEDGFEVALDEFADAINAKDVLRVKTHGAGRFAVKTQAYERSGPDFLDGLKQYARHYFAFELRSPNDVAENPEAFEDLKL